MTLRRRGPRLCWLAALWLGASACDFYVVLTGRPGGDGGDAGAGLDGGNSDGGVSDGGASDGGLSDGGLSDGGLSDGGLSDGGLSDGGLSDGGASDGGTSDGGLGDAGTPDGGTPDGGGPDAGPIDAGFDGGAAFNRRISLGDGHACTIDSAGSLFCWGDNRQNQLGTLPSAGWTPTPQLVEDGGWSSVSAGEHYTCAIKAGGELYCWGENGSGRLGVGDSLARTVPTRVDAPTLYSAVSAGVGHTCGILRLTDQLRCWGQNSDGQLGDGTTNDQSVPVPVTQVSLVATVTVGDKHTCALSPSGSLRCWGNNGANQLGGDAGVHTGLWQSISAERFHSLGVQSNGTLWGWGLNDWGQLLSVPSYTEGQLGASPNWRRVSTGKYHSCGVRNDGTLWCWGQNDYSAVGIGGSDQGSNSAGTPVTVTTQVGTGADWFQVDATGISTCGVRDGGSVWCWGSNEWGQLADPQGRVGNKAIPVQVFGNEKWLDVAPGYSHTCGLRLDGGVACWGKNLSRELGDGTFYFRKAPSTVVSAGPAWLKVSAGYEFSCGVRGDESLWCWGYDGTGSGKTGGPAFPPGAVGDGGFALTSTGLNHACGVRQNGELLCWGDDSAGQLGSAGNSTPEPRPVGPGFIEVSASRIRHTCAVKTGGQVECWGFNGSGELGSGDTIQRVLPHPNSVTTAAEVATGDDHSCARLMSGGLQCWGANSQGQLGAGGPGGTSLPQTVPLVTVSGLAAGSNHTCAIANGGTVYCWGRAAEGQLGFGVTRGMFQNPTPAISGFTRLRAGWSHTCGVDSSNNAWCWGAGGDGQLGDNEAWTDAPRQALVP